jgi:hypothetical protein
MTPIARVVLWILPFTPAEPDPALEHLQHALPALVSVAISSSSGTHEIVEREQLDRVMREQSLSLAQLASPETRQRVGKLLGATVMLSGSFAGQGSRLHVTMRATDLETGVVTSTADGIGPLSQPGTLVTSLYRRLAVDLGRRLPELAPHQIDDVPLSNLHFMKGLGHYYSARYSHAIAEFMRAGDDTRLAGISRLWRARAYLAERQYSQAYLELVPLTSGATSSVQAHDVTAILRECETHLSGDDMRMLRDIAAKQHRPSRQGVVR